MVEKDRSKKRKGERERLESERKSLEEILKKVRDLICFPSFDFVVLSISLKVFVK